MQVDVQTLDAQMVALHRKQNSLQVVLQRQRELCQQLTQVASHHTTNCLQSLVLSHVLALPLVSNKKQKGKCTPFCCRDKSLLRCLVGMTLRVGYATHMLQLAAGRHCDIVMMLLLQLVLSASGFESGSEPLSWETATTHCSRSEYITTKLCYVIAIKRCLEQAHCNGSTTMSLSNNLTQNRVFYCHIQFSLSCVN